jgi:hypothetical protein
MLDDAVHKSSLFWGRFLFVTSLGFRAVADSIRIANVPGG